MCTHCVYNASLSHKYSSTINFQSYHFYAEKNFSLSLKILFSIVSHARFPFPREPDIFFSLILLIDQFERLKLFAHQILIRNLDGRMDYKFKKLIENVYQFEKSSTCDFHRPEIIHRLSAIWILLCRIKCVKNNVCHVTRSRLSEIRGRAPCAELLQPFLLSRACM